MPRRAAVASRRRAQRRVVGLRQVGEARAEPLVVGPLERVVAEQVQVVLDPHQVARLVLGVDAARGVGEEEQPRPQERQHPRAEGHVGGAPPLVAVHAPLQRGHRERPLRRGEVPHHQPPGVALHPRDGELGDAGVGDGHRALEAGGEAAQARAEHHPRARGGVGAPPDAGHGVREAVVQGGAGHEALYRRSVSPVPLRGRGNACFPRVNRKAASPGRRLRARSRT